MGVIYHMADIAGKCVGIRCVSFSLHKVKFQRQNRGRKKKRIGEVMQFVKPQY